MFGLSASKLAQCFVLVTVLVIVLFAEDSSVEARRRNRKNVDVTGAPGRHRGKHNGKRQHRSSLRGAGRVHKNSDTLESYRRLRKQGSRRITHKSPAVTKWTEANVSVGTKVDNFSIKIFEESLGKFGHHSARQSIVGRVIHISDPGRGNTHHGCGHTMSNRHLIPKNETWVALIKRGHCYFFNKIKLGERYNASAVVIYDDKPGKIEVMNTIGTKIVSLMINHDDGIRFAALADSGIEVYMNITVGREVHDRVKAHPKTPAAATYAAPEAIVSTMGGRGSGSTVSPSIAAIFSLIALQVICGLLNKR
uniref:PA domain-containing protein n=1 Tax=Ciona savignyi TaxID=51511 RepID=H2ZIF4_CIOSA